MRYLYYKLWQNFKRVKTNDMPATNAMIFISMIQFLNVGLIYIFITYYSSLKLEFASKSDIYILSIIFGGTVYTINYFYLYKNRRRLYEKYTNESKRRKITGNVLLILYVLVSFVLVLYFGSKFFPYNG